VGFSEPLSFLQRLTEDLEYSDCLDAAAALGDDDSCLRLAYVTAFSVSGYANTTERLFRPFNPLLGETYECNRKADLGWRSIAEKVCQQGRSSFFEWCKRYPNKTFNHFALFPPPLHFYLFPLSPNAIFWSVPLIWGTYSGPCKTRKGLKLLTVLGRARELTR